MRMMIILLKIMLLVVIILISTIHGSAGDNISPSPIPPGYQPMITKVESPASSAYAATAPMPLNSQGPSALMPLSPPPMSTEYNLAPPPPILDGLSPSMPPTASSNRRSPTIGAPISPPFFPGTPVDPSKSASPPSISSFPSGSYAPTRSPSDNLVPPFKSSPQIPERNWSPKPASSPLISSENHNYASKTHQPAPAPTYPYPSSSGQGSVAPPASQPPTAIPKKGRHRHHSSPRKKQDPWMSQSSPSPSTSSQGSPAPAPLSTASNRMKGPFRRKPRTPFPSQVLTLPPPPPNNDCTSLTCTEPLVNTPPGSLCGCVWPIQVGLRFDVALYTFFPLVTQLAQEIGIGVFMEQSQVRIMGANADGQQLDKTTVLVDLVPRGEKFDNSSAYFTYQRFWNKQVFIKPYSFGDYEVLYVRYPGTTCRYSVSDHIFFLSPPEFRASCISSGLPPSPPSAPSITSIGEGLNSVRGNGRTMHPLAVDIRKKKKVVGSNVIAIIILSSCLAIGLCVGAAFLLSRKFGKNTNHISKLPQTSLPPSGKPPGPARSMILGSGPSSASGSSIAAYTGSAKTFSAGDIKKATNNFDASKVLGEGGFGLVYGGTLDDGKEIAVKVLKRNDQQGGREFLAEVEMLSRLHHRNLVKLIGICVEDQARCLVYELIPNGSVDLHLHGVEKKTAPLDWSARMKIALGAARGLAYLHEDSSPCVIHRDFKSSNILLEYDFTPKVSDFGLARTGLDEANKHISTHIMGTFGYVAPEYAMTGHLLVKSDVYSYGVVLLELLTGRKPVDMSRPQGQENLVTWARPLLSNMESLEMIIDPFLGSVPLDSIAKVAAIASMCVQPEVSNRPFMGEVVQALKLVSDESDETKASSGSCSHEDLTRLGTEVRVSTRSDQHQASSRADYRMIDYDSSHETPRPLSVSEVFDSSPGFGRSTSGSFRRHSSSGPLRTGKSTQFWERVRGISRGSMSEHRLAFKFWEDSH